MKIPLNVCNFAGGLRAMTKFLLQSDNPHIFMPVEAVVDTGSPTTIVGMLDVQRARLSVLQLKKLESRKEKTAYGGAEIETKILQNSKLKFGNFFECVMPIQIAITPVGKVSPPTIIGVDFMAQNKFKLIFDPYKKEAYFESSE